MEAEIKYEYVPSTPLDIVSHQTCPTISPSVAAQSFYNARTRLLVPRAPRLHCIPLPCLDEASTPAAKPTAPDTFPIDLALPLYPLPGFASIRISSRRRIHIHTPTQHIGILRLLDVHPGRTIGVDQVLRYVQNVIASGNTSLSGYTKVWGLHKDDWSEDYILHVDV